VDDGLTLHRRRGRRHPAEKLAGLDYTDDDIALLEDTISGFQTLLCRVGKSFQEIGLYLNASKTNTFILNPTTNNGIVATDFICDRKS